MTKLICIEIYDEIICDVLCKLICLGREAFVFGISHLYAGLPFLITKVSQPPGPLHLLQLGTFL